MKNCAIIERWWNVQQVKDFFLLWFSWRKRSLMTPIWQYFNANIITQLTFFLLPAPRYRTQEHLISLFINPMRFEGGMISQKCKTLNSSRLLKVERKKIPFVGVFSVQTFEAFAWIEFGAKWKCEKYFCLYFISSRSNSLNKFLLIAQSSMTAQLE